MLKEKNDLEKKIDNLIDTISMLENQKDKNPYMKRVQEYSSQISAIDLKLADFAAIDVNDFKENIDYYSLSIEKRKAIINKLIDKIIVTDNSAEDRISEMPYKVELIWKNEISEEYRELYKESTKNFSEEDFT